MTKINNKWKCLLSLSQDRALEKVCKTPEKVQRTRRQLTEDTRNIRWDVQSAKEQESIWTVGHWNMVLRHRQGKFAK